MLDAVNVAVTWPGLHVVGTDGKPHNTTTFSLTALTMAGALMPLAGARLVAVAVTGSAPRPTRCSARCR